ncbi:MAG TPA: phosphatase PAP2 family protein [Gemmatimonadales bacterium]|nr:phosphatase PAP2 family protein [Gemmatimonadales bacterium]
MGAILQTVGQLDRTWMLGLARRHVPRWLDRAFRLGTHLGGATATLATGLLLTLVSATRPIGLAALIANAASHIVAQLLKRRFVRPRPHLQLGALDPLIPIPDAFSFPSGHACAAMAVAATVAASTPLVIGIPAVALALFVGLSRVYLRVHFVTDVLVGGVLGLGGALFGWSVIGSR